MPDDNRTLDHVPLSGNLTRPAPEDERPPDRPLAVPETAEATVAGFEIIRELGRGGMGVVYLARQIRLNRLVALKMILAGGHASETERQRFLAEAEAVASVQHPGIIGVYEFGTSGGQPFFALEYCTGGSLARKLAGTPLPATEAATLVATLARAIQAAHDRGIVHRDLKPDNVLFSADGTPKVTDFGLARKVQAASGLTRTGAILGTPSYMAPEQASGEKEVAPAADVWALGAMLYECLTGRPPFRAATPLDTVLQVLHDEPVAPRSLHPRLPRDLDTICMKCLQKAPARRYPTAAALADDLHRFLSGDPIRARPVSVTERVWKAIKKRPTAATLVALTFLCSLTALLGFVWVTYAHNQELQDERNRAEQRRQEAEAERLKAHTRLEKAVESVERMHRRIGGSKWARDPVLVAERRGILEDMVAFYEGLYDGDADDPLVRRETARSYRRIGRVYLLLAEYDRAAEYLGRARAMSAKLLREYPENGEHAADLAEAIRYFGHVASSSGRHEDAQEAYREAAGVARQAVARLPADDEARRTLISCLSCDGFYRMAGNRTAAAALFAEADRHVDELMARPAVPFSTRALAAYTAAAAATFEYGTGRFAVGKTRESQAVKILSQTRPDPSAPAEYLDLFDMTRGLLKMSGASHQVAGGNLDRAAAEFREAEEIFDSLLALYPRTFQYRLYKLMILAQEIGVLTSLKRTEEAGRARRQLFALEKEMLITAPNKMVIQAMTAGLRVNDLLQRAKSGEVDGTDGEVEALLAAVKATAAAEYFQYNLACVLAQASLRGSPAEREARATRAVGLLKELLKGSFFRGLTDAAHIEKDKDLDPLRKRADFRAFLVQLPRKK